MRVLTSAPSVELAPLVAGSELPGSFDAHCTMAAAQFVTHRGEHSIYYVGNPVRHEHINKPGVPKGAVRGRHAHKKDKQLLVCLKGAVKVTLDSGGSPSEFFLSEGKSLFMDSLVWGIQEYTTGENVLLVLCSEEHDPEDYITHYFKFLELVKEKTDV